MCARGCSDKFCGTVMATFYHLSSISGWNLPHKLQSGRTGNFQRQTTTLLSHNGISQQVNHRYTSTGGSLATRHGSHLTHTIMWPTQCQDCSEMCHGRASPHEEDPQPWIREQGQWQGPWKAAVGGQSGFLVSPWSSWFGQGTFRWATQQPWRPLRG